MRRNLVILVLSFAALVSFAAPPAGRGVHKVREGETLGAIAKRYGVSTTDLATFNKLEDADDLLVGQLIRVPQPGAVAKKAPPAPRHPMPAEMKASLDKLRVIPGKWRYVVVHHSASASGKRLLRSRRRRSRELFQTRELRVRESRAVSGTSSC